MKKKKNVVLFSNYLDVGFITGVYVIDQALMFQIEAVAGKGSYRSIAQDRLVGNRNTED